MHAPAAEDAEPWQRPLGAVLFAAIAALGLAVVGTLSSALWPSFTRSAAGVASSRSGTALLAGLALALGGPLAVGLLSLSLVGIPLALFVACAYLVSLPLGYVVAAISIAERLRQRPPTDHGRSVGARALALFTALFALGLFAVVPFIGPFAIVVLALIGAGAVVLEAGGRLRRRDRTESVERGDPNAESQRPAAARDATLMM